MRIDGLKNISCLVLLLFLLNTLNIKAQEVENSSQTRTALTFSLKPIKNLKLDFTPEVRFDEGFSVGKYLIESEVSYKFFKFLSLGTSYRFVSNPRETKGTEYLHRFALSSTFKKKFNRFEPAFRLRYTNYADDESDKEFLRYKVSVKYNIAKSKITPFVGTEAFQQISGSSELYKMRYIIGMDYKLFKKNYIGVGYKLDYYMNKYENKHILSIGYKIKF